MKKLLMCAAILGLSAGSARAAIITADDVGETGTIFFNGMVGTTVVPELLARVDAELVSYTESTLLADGSVVFELTVDNISAIDSRLVAFGFNTNPEVNADSLTEDADEFTEVVIGSAFPNSFGPIDLCLKGGQANNCQGGTGAGLAPGDTPDTFTLTLYFDSLGDSLTIDGFGARWQAITGVSANGNTYNDASGTGVGTPGGTLFEFDPVPEPTSMVLLGLGFARRRPRSSSQVKPSHSS